MIYFESIEADENGGDKYRLTKKFERQLPEAFQDSFYRHAHALIDGHGTLTVFLGYRWDGASGAIDSATFMEGSCIHDVLCDMMDNGTLPRSMWISAAKAMRAVNKREGMPWARRQWTYAAVVLHGFRTWGRKECSLTS